MRGACCSFLPTYVLTYLLKVASAEAELFFLAETEKELAQAEGKARDLQEALERVERRCRQRSEELEEKDEELEAKNEELDRMREELEHWRRQKRSQPPASVSQPPPGGSDATSSKLTAAAAEVRVSVSGLHPASPHT